MNTKVIDQLVIRYQQTKHNPKIRNMIFNNITYQYEYILKKIIKSINYYKEEEVRSLFWYLLLTCIETYNSKICSFNTYFYYRTLSIPRLIFEGYDMVDDNNYTRKINEDNKIYNDISCQDNTYKTDMIIDLPKILTTDEMLIYDAFINGKLYNKQGKSAINRKTRLICKKIKDYLTC